MWQPLDPVGWRGSKRSDLEGVRQSVKAIIERIKEGGDSALREITLELDGVSLNDVRVSEAEMKEAYDVVDPSLVKGLNDAYYRIHRFHRMQMPPSGWFGEAGPGIILGVKVDPLQRVGAYIPGGRAAYPSTALMATVPARVAGVPQICCCTPPPVNPATLVALHISGVKEIYTVGGAQAIACMALGTETIVPVQKIVGPGNLYVTAAKMMIRDHADIDFPAGPSEILVLADDSADPHFIASDILAQAEHDPDASCALVTTDPSLPQKVWERIQSRLEGIARKDIVRVALEKSGYLVADSLKEAFEIVSYMAPEHLSIQLEDPWAAVDQIRNAGAIFVGRYSAVACGDYASGTNHILPTAGYSTTYSGLDVNHFLRRTTVQIVTKDGLEHIGDLVEELARSEGLDEHARSVSIRRG